jgi:hypothetical protein
MYKSLLMTLVSLAFIFNATAQEPPGKVVESIYFTPKRGMAKQLEAAVKKHNEKFHPEGAYQAFLRHVDYGENAGSYVWLMGPTAYSSLDTRPKDEGHEGDWDKTIDPLIEKYKNGGLWELQDDLSFGLDMIRNSGHYEIWSVDLKRGEFYRFKAMAEKLKKTYESINQYGFLVLTNPVHTKDGNDVALVWSFKTYGDWANGRGTREAYEKLYGENSWQSLIDEWQDITVDYDTEIRSIIK